MSKLLFTFIIVLSLPSWSIDKKVGTENKSSSKNQELASYLLIAPDAQTFALSEFNFEGHKLHQLEFLIGQRSQSKKIIEKKQWEQWRTKWNFLYQSLRVTPDCVHGLQLVKKLGATVKGSKVFCLTKLTNSDRNEIKEFTAELEKRLYE